jgi:hypothetical protein
MTHLTLRLPSLEDLARNYAEARAIHELNDVVPDDELNRRTDAKWGAKNALEAAIRSQHPGCLGAKIGEAIHLLPSAYTDDYGEPKPIACVDLRLIAGL